MQIIQLLNIIILSTVVMVNGFLDYNIINEYCHEKFVKYALILGCFTRQEQLSMLKTNLNNKRIAVLNIKRITVEEYLKNNHRHIGIILDGDCDNVHQFLVNNGKFKYFNIKHHWLVLLSTINYTSIFENVEMYINADIQVVYPRSNDNNNTTRNYIIEEVYNPAFKRGGSLRRYKSGYYNEIENYRIRRNSGKYWMRKNMTGVTLLTTIVLPVPFKGSLMDYLNSENHREINTFNRFHYNVLASCKNYYNFTANVTLSSSWGYKKQDGTFDGLVGALERGMVDYGSSPLFLRTDRAHVMLYGRRTWTLRAAFIFRNPKFKNSVDAFVKPLSMSIWLLTLCSACFIIIFLKLNYLYEKKDLKKNVETSWSYFVICTIGALCQQGMTTTPIFFSGRIVTLFMFLLSLLIYQFYSGSLVSHLLMKPQTRIKTIKDILHSNMKVGCEDILYNKDYFSYTTDSASKELYYKKILGKGNVSNFLSPEDGLELVKKGQYAFHVEVVTAYPIIRKTFKEKVICQLQEVQMYRTQQMHSNMQKDSPYRDMFDTCLQRLAEIGILSREIIFWHPVKPECVHSRAVIFNLGLEDFYPTLMVLGIGILLSLMILSIEITFHFRKNSIKKKTEVIIIYPFVK